MLNVIYMSCSYCVPIPNSVKCIACEIKKLLHEEIRRTPAFECFKNQRIYLKMDEKQNVIVKNYYGDPNRIIASLFQSDAYQIAREKLSSFQIIIESFKYEGEFPILCEVIPK